MPKEMELASGSGSQNTGAKDAVGIAFATRAMAVIQVHDSAEAKARNLTLRQICCADEYLRDHADTLSAYLFRAFGRNCLPVLQSFLEGVQEPAELEATVRSYARVIQHNLGLTVV